LISTGCSFKPLRIRSGNWLNSTPSQLAGLRQLSAGILYVTYFLIIGAPFPKGKEWRPLLLLALLNFILSNGLSTWGVKYISAGLAAIMGAIFPIWLVVIGLFTSKERLPRKAITGLLIGFTGVCIIFYDHLHDFLDPSFRFGILLSLLATWSWAFATLYTKQQAAHFNPYFSMGIQMLNGIRFFFFVLPLCLTTFTNGASIDLCLC